MTLRVQYKILGRDGYKITGDQPTHSLIPAKKHSWFYMDLTEKFPEEECNIKVY